MAVKERKRVFGHVHLSGILGASAGLRGGHAAVFPLLLRILPCVSFLSAELLCIGTGEKMSRNRSLTVWVVDSCRWLYIGLHVVF